MVISGKKLHKIKVRINNIMTGNIQNKVCKIELIYKPSKPAYDA
jgi:hypothetical protein